jgi:DnaK suppressor protein
MRTMPSISKTGELENFRKALVALEARLRGDLSTMSDDSSEEGNLASIGRNYADPGSESYDHDFLLGLVENEQSTLEEVRSALSRIDLGTYGKCEGCGEAIAKPRLQALPYTRLCINCARARESEQP